MTQRSEDDHFERINGLLLALETDLYNEPLRAALAGEKDDLARLLSALRAVKSVNRLARAEGLSSPLEARIRGARALLAEMRAKGELRDEEGVFTVSWGRTDGVELPAVAFLLSRAELFLRLAAAELASGEAAGAAPECSR